jgi:hypothetical protein
METVSRACMQASDERKHKNVKRAWSSSSGNSDEDSAGDEDCAVDTVVLCETLQGFMHGKRICKEKDLTREIMLSALRLSGSIRRCAKLLQFNVATLDGETTVINIEYGEETSTVEDVKQEIEEATGMKKERQLLFLSGRAGSDGDSGGGTLSAMDACALPLRLVLEESCNLDVIVGQAMFTWDYTSELLPDKAPPRHSFLLPLYVVEDVGALTARRTGVELARRMGHYMMAVPAMRPVQGAADSDNIFVISLRMDEAPPRTVFPIRGPYDAVYLDVNPDPDAPVAVDADERTTSCGFAVENTPALQDPFYGGNLHPISDRHRNDMGGFHSYAVHDVPHGRVLTMEADFNRGTVRLWLDGKVFRQGLVKLPFLRELVSEEAGAGHSQNGLCWGVCVPKAGVVAAIVETPADLER